MAFRCISQRVFSTAFKSRNLPVPSIKHRSPPTLQRPYSQMAGEKKYEIGDKDLPDRRAFQFCSAIGFLTGAFLSRKV